MLLSLYRNPRLFFTGFILLISTLYWIFPDIMPFHQGFGFEGYTIYKPLAIDVRQHLLTARMNSYSIQRIFPFLLLHTVFKAIGISFTDAHMLLFFQVFQLGLALLIISIWDRLARFLQLGLAGQWVGYLSMLVNFATLKLDFYIPFNYDRLGLATGLLSLYFYLTHRPLVLLLNSLLALTIWPTAVFFNILMLLVPATEETPKTTNILLSRVWAGVVVSVISGLFILVVYIKQIPGPERLAPSIRPLLPISLLFVTIYLGYTQSTLAQRLFPGWKELGAKLTHLLRPQWSWIYISILTAVYFLLTRILGDAAHPYLTPQQFAINLTYGALQRPAQFLIFHALYYGLPIILLVLFWQRTLNAVTRLGLGSCLLLLIVLVQSVNSETRQLANVLPMLAVLAAIVGDELKPKPATILATTISMMVLSKIWLKLNYFDPQFGQKNDIFPMLNFEKQEFLRWPQQVYFMNFGPWASTPYLIVQLLALMCISSFIYWLWVRKPKQHQLTASILESPNDYN